MMAGPLTLPEGRNGQLTAIGMTLAGILILWFAIAAPMYHLLERPLTMRGRRMARVLVGRAKVRRVRGSAVLDAVEAARSPGIG